VPLVWQFVVGTLNVSWQLLLLPFFCLSSSATLKIPLSFHALCINLWSIFFPCRKKRMTFQIGRRKVLISYFLLIFLYCILSSVSISCACASFLLCIFVLSLIPEVCGTKRKSQSFRDEDCYISSVPQNQVCLVHPAQRVILYSLYCTRNVDPVLNIQTYSWL